MMVWRPELLSRCQKIAVTIDLSVSLTVFSDTSYIYVQRKLMKATHCLGLRLDFSGSQIKVHFAKCPEPADGSSFTRVWSKGRHWISL